jgi:tRNA threonylcarbamoyl adenosine modification protein (Sua5/YciO/YrdC/YwlC family)
LSTPDLTEAVAALRAGLVVVIPTDTVYGVAVDPSVSGATKKLFEAKRRPTDVRLPVLVDSVDQAATIAEVDERARTLMQRFWPGGLTIILPFRSGVDLAIGNDSAIGNDGAIGNGAGVPTVGVRCPDNEVARALCRTVGPLATTSANLHGEATPPTAGEVRDLFGDAVAVVIDGGRCEGAPSTVVDGSGPALALRREGCVPWHEVLGVVG